MIRTTQHFRSDEHALYCGFVLGLALAEDRRVSPVLDDDGNYTPQIELDINQTRVVLTIPPPPADWWMVQ